MFTTTHDNVGGAGHPAGAVDPASVVDPAGVVDAAGAVDPAGSAPAAGAARETAAVPGPAATPHARAGVRPRRLGAAVGGGLAGLALWGVAVPVLGVDLVVRGPAGTGSPVGAAAVVLAAVLAGLAGWAVLAVLERHTSRARAIWTVLALAVVVLSLGGPVSEALNPGAAVALAAMHLAVGAVVILLMRRTARQRARA